MFQQQAKEGGGEKGVEYKAIPYLSFIFYIEMHIYLGDGEHGHMTSHQCFFEHLHTIYRTLCFPFISKMAEILNFSSFALVNLGVQSPAKYPPKRWKYSPICILSLGINFERIRQV